MADAFFAHTKGRRRAKPGKGGRGRAVCDCCREAPKRRAQRLARARLKAETQRELDQENPPKED